MAIILERDALARALQAYDKIVETRSTIPILANVRLTADAGNLTITANNLTEEIAATVPAEVSAAFDVTARSDRLKAFVNKVSKGAQVAIEATDSDIEVKAGRSRLNLQTMPAADFPPTAKNDEGQEFTLEAVLATELFRRPQIAISSEETRYYLNGIYLAPYDGALAAVATDGHRLIKTAVPMPGGLRPFKGIIIPRDAVSRIVDFLGAGRPLAFRVNEARIEVRDENIVYRSKLIDGTFPDWERVVPRDAARVLTIQREPVMVAVDRTITVSNERGRAIKLCIDRPKREILFRVKNVDVGDAEEVAEIDEIDDNVNSVVKPADEIGFNARYLLDHLGAMQGDQVLMHLNTAGDQAKFTEPDNPNALFILMPMRV